MTRLARTKKRHGRGPNQEPRAASAGTTHNGYGAKCKAPGAAKADQLPHRLRGPHRADRHPSWAAGPASNHCNLASTLAFMKVGLALPHYDFSYPSEQPATVVSVQDYARRAEALGFDSVWVSDHLFLDLARYGGPPRRYGTPEATTM